MINSTKAIPKLGYEAFELIWNNTNDAIFTIGYDGAILTINRAFTDILGWDMLELKEVSMPPFIIHNEVQQKQLDLFKQGKNLPYFVTKRKRKDGKIIEVLASYRSINNGEVLAIGMYKDFTEQMEMQRRLQSSEECYRNLIEFLPDAIFVKNKEHIVFVNSAGVRLFGAEDIEDIIGHSFWEFIWTEKKDEIENNMNLITNQNQEVMVERFVRFDGKVIWAEMMVMPITYKGEPVIQVQIRDITEKKNYEMQLEYLAFHDPLTGLSNRRYFIEMMGQMMEKAEDLGHMLAIMYIDIDKFKQINDSLGHGIGDELLKQFAKRLKENVRKNDILCRIGGDEFLVLLSNIKEKKCIGEIAERLYAAFQIPYKFKDQEIVVTLSIGISIFPESATDSRSLILYADQALYKAKEKRNRIVFHH
ncbi:sensor domain-containing diguanylate cyclase [Niallia oryzisoli]|uniref:Sensor domain-containing diguanylate cyclase n=1 Tax=Niallia oryzisoli TaxID=1737571 RepID=A0ABZ2CHY2_9BACI